MPPPEPLAPGLAARIAAAQILADTLAMGRPLEERFSGENIHARLGALDLSDRALTRSIATVSLRRLGTIRKALGRFLEKGLPKKSGALEWTLVVAGGPDSISRCARSRRGRSCRARRQG